MRNLNFTPGPWKTDTDKLDIVYYNVTDSKGKILLYATSVQIGDKECEANTKLASAAPELYDALKIVKEKYLDSANFLPGDTNKIYEALARAEGVD